jgi:hypothetical protein
MSVGTLRRQLRRRSGAQARRDTALALPSLNPAREAGLRNRMQHGRRPRQRFAAVPPRPSWKG